jgi:hypothetical protein
VSQHFDFDMSALHNVHWNVLLPGDTFRVLYGDAHRAISNPAAMSFGNPKTFLTFGAVYTVISRRLGPEFPVPKDYYVILGEGVPLEEIKL